MKFRAPKWARDIKTETSQDGCEDYAPFLMALFDGEADDVSARRARAHLLVCERCAHAWLDWNQTRSLLAAQPVPAPPPTLMWRILMACRINAQARSNENSPVVARPTAPKPNLARTPVTPGEGAPADLAALILNQTTRVAAPTPVVTASRRSRPVAPVYRSLRLRWKTAPMLAMPALAAFLLISSRADWLMAVNSTPQGVPDTVELPLESIQEASASSATFNQPQKSKGLEVGQPRLKNAAVVPPHSTPAVASRPTVAAVHRDTTPDVTPDVAPIRNVVEERHSRNEAEPVRRVRDYERPAMERNVSMVAYRPHVEQERSAPEREVAPPPEVKVVKAALPTPPAKLFNASKSATGSVGGPRIQFANFRSAEFSDDAVIIRPSLTRSVVPERRVPILRQSSIDNSRTPMRVSAPVVPDPKVRLISTSPIPDDTHIDELPSAVQDFRATLADDTTDWSSEDAG